jgi:hypothetical protein
MHYCKHPDIILDDRYHGGIYGVPDEVTIEAIKFGARTEGFITDPVYEGKSLAGLMDMVRREEIGEGKKVLYAHLGVTFSGHSTPYLGTKYPRSRPIFQPRRFLLPRPKFGCGTEHSFGRS